MKIFLSSDTHFDDEFVIYYFNRPSINVDEMNAVMVETWHSVVTENDTVYHLGEFTVDDSGHFTKWASPLNGAPEVIIGIGR